LPCSAIKRALVLRGGALGDFVLTLPVIRALRCEFGAINVVANRKFSELGADAKFALDDVELAPFFTPDAKLPPRWRDYFREHDLVLSYLHDPEGIFERNVRSCGTREFVSGPHKFRPGAHATEQLARPLARLGIAITDFVPRFELSESERNLAPRQTGLLVLHPGSGSPGKNWPIENWSALIDELLSVAAVAGGGSPTVAGGGSGVASTCVERPRPATAATTGQHIVVVGGEADEKNVGHIRERFADRIDYVINWPLRRLAALLGGARFIGHDSGISHLAAAAGAHCTLLFGPTDPAVWAPRNTNVRVLVAPQNEWSRLAIGDVCAALESSFPSSGLAKA
jgi:heptosyltransferase III